MLAAGSLIIGSSFVWPKLTGTPRPPLLEEVHTKLLETDMGKQTEAVLGTSDEPIDLASESSKLIQTVGGEVQKKSEELIKMRIVDELLKRFDSLTPEQQKEVQEKICQ